MVETSGTTSQVRWLVVGPVNLAPTEKSFTLHRTEFMEWLEKKELSLEATIEDGLGGRGKVTVSIGVDKLRALTLKSVTQSVPELKKLLEIASDVRDPSATLKAVEALVGAGTLTEKITELGEIPPANKLQAEAGSVLEQADMPTQKSAASSAVDAFLKQAQKSPRRVKQSKSARKIRDAIEEAVFLEAKRILETPSIADVERSLRGLWFMVGQCHSKAGLVVEVHDVPLEEVCDTVRNLPTGDLTDEPDGIFVPCPVSDTKLLEEFAFLGEEKLCPIFVEFDPTVLEAKNNETLTELLEDLEPKNAESRWLSLRQEEQSRWLCAVANGVVLLAEGTGIAKRVVVGSGIWAFGAILSKSYAETGSFARLTGRPGSISAPGVRTLEGGRHDGMAAPTEVFIPIRGQAQFAKHGLLALGSSRNSDVVVLAQVPMVRASSDAVPVPAQLLTGRIVRFASWVRDQLPPKADADTARSVFREAAKVFLFPGMTDVGEVDATILEEDDKRMLNVYANISPHHAGIPFELAFPLHLED